MIMTLSVSYFLNHTALGENISFTFLTTLVVSHSLKRSTSARTAMVTAAAKKLTAGAMATPFPDAHPQCQEGDPIYFANVFTC